MSTPSPAPTTGFDQYQQSSGSSVTLSNTGLSSGQAFPQQYAQAPYPGISSRELSLTVPGSGSAPVPNNPAGPGHYGGVAGGTPDQSLQQLMDNLASQSQANPDAIGQLQDKLILAGYLDPRSKTYTPGGFVQPGDATWTAYRNLLLDATRQKTSYLDLLDQKVQSGVGDQKYNLTQTYQSIAVTDPQTARQTLASVMENELGRRPTNAEITDYAQKLAFQEQGNPTTTTTTTDVNAYLNNTTKANSASRSQTTTGGTDPSEIAEQQIYNKNGPELAQTRATEVYGLFLRMLNGEGSLG